MAAEPSTNGSRIGDTVQDVAERVSVLVHEEIELAKAELSVKARRLGVGAAVGAAAGMFVALAVIMGTIALGWVWYDYHVVDKIYLGFLIAGAILLILAGLAGMLAYRFVKKGTPPTPELAIEEAKRIRETVQSKGEGTPAA